MTGTTFDQEKPAAGASATFLQLFGVAQAGNPGAFDADNRLWPRPGDPGYSIASAAPARRSRRATGATDQFLVFPSLEPFARAGLAQPAANPSNDAIYSTPGIYLYSPQHPQPVFRLRLSISPTAAATGPASRSARTQLRPLSERLTLDDGTMLKRGVDYTMDYDLGRVTFLHPDTLFAQPKNVTVRYEENPLFVTAPTSIFGLASTLPLRFGEINFIALGQSQNTTFTRPPLGYEAQSSLIAGLNGNFNFNADAIARLVGQTPRRESQRAGPPAPAGRGRDEPAAVRRLVAGVPRELRGRRRHHDPALRSQLVPLEPARARQPADVADRRRRPRSISRAPPPSRGRTTASIPPASR